MFTIPSPNSYSVSSAQKISLQCLADFSVKKLPQKTSTNDQSAKSFKTVQKIFLLWCQRPVSLDTFNLYCDISQGPIFFTALRFPGNAPWIWSKAKHCRLEPKVQEISKWMEILTCNWFIHSILALLKFISLVCSDRFAFGRALSPGHLEINLKEVWEVLA